MSQVSAVPRLSNKQLLLNAGFIFGGDMYSSLRNPQKMVRAAKWGPILSLSTIGLLLGVREAAKHSDDKESAEKMQQVNIKLMAAVGITRSVVSVVTVAALVGDRQKLSVRRAVTIAALRTVYSATGSLIIRKYAKA